MNDVWESEIGGLLSELAEVQTLLLATLSEKRKLLVSRDKDALAAMSAREQDLANRLQACNVRRQGLLTRAQAEGLPSESIQSLSESLPAASRERMHASIQDTANRTKLLQHQSLTNWVLVQRSLLHLSQLIEIIATGGRLKPTYGKGSDNSTGGVLVDQAA